MISSLLSSVGLVHHNGNYRSVTFGYYDRYRDRQ